MKKPLVTLIGAAALLAAVTTQAQTNQITNLMPPVTNSISLGGLLTGGSWPVIGQGIENGISFLEGTTNSGLIQVEGGGLYATSIKKYGGFANVYFPIGSTNSIFGAGFGFAYIDQNFYNGTVNGRIGSALASSGVLRLVYAYAESGGGINMSTHTAMAQAFAGALIDLPITKTFTWTAGGAIGTISDVPGNIYAFGTSVVFHFGNAGAGTILGIGRDMKPITGGWYAAD